MLLERWKAMKKGIRNKELGKAVKSYTYSLTTDFENIWLFKDFSISTFKNLEQVVLFIKTEMDKPPSNFTGNKPQRIYNEWY
jgi:hypothetical protein